MSDDFRISAVIPAYNAEPFLRRCIDSILAQTFKPLEIIVVDDGSTDNTASIAKSYGDAIRYIYQENAGVAAARNTGIFASRGDWIAFLDNDDEWRLHHLANAVKILEAHPELKWYGASANQYIHDTGKLFLEYKEKKPGILVDNAYFEDYMAVSSPYAIFFTSTMVIHKSVFDKVGIFKTELYLGEDKDMWYRIGLRFPKIGYCHEVAANYYKRSTSLWHSTIRHFNKSLEIIRESESLAESMGEDVRKRAEPKIIFWVTNFLKASIKRGDYQHVREIFNIYKKRLPPRWLIFASFYLAMPGTVHSALALCNIFNKRRHELRANSFQLPWK